MGWNPWLCFNSINNIIYIIRIFFGVSFSLFTVPLLDFPDLTRSRDSIETITIFGIQGSAVRETLRPVLARYITPQIIWQQRWVPRSSLKLEIESRNMIQNWALAPWKYHRWGWVRLVGTLVFIHCFYRIHPPLEAPAGDLNFLSFFKLDINRTHCCGRTCHILPQRQLPQ